MLLLRGDCLEVMKGLPDNSVDMLLTDLPYGTTKCKWDTPIDLEKFWPEVNRVVRRGGCKALFAQTPFDKVLGCSNIKQLRYEWIWEKTDATGYLNSKKMPMKAHENILIFYDRLPTYNPQMSEGHTPVHSFTKYLETQNRTQVYGKATKTVSGGGSTKRYPRSVVKGSTDKQRLKLHSTQKPEWLCEMLVRTYTNPGDTVLDCCMGSGTIGVVCKRLGRDFIGIEKDPMIFETAKKRIVEEERYDTV